jgi:hypothetical protein
VKPAGIGLRPILAVISDTKLCRLPLHRSWAPLSSMARVAALQVCQAKPDGNA